MTPQEIHIQLKKILDDLCEIDSSETFTQMLADDSFLIDDDDMGYLVHQVEQLLAAVKVFAEFNTNEKETSATAAAQSFASCATNFRFAPIPNQARLPHS